MVFVDGENLAIRCGKILQEKSETLKDSVVYVPDIYVWPKLLNNICLHGGVIRKHYYTSVQGDTPLITDIEDKLKDAGIEAPNVFKKTKGKRSKRVDISLATDMLLHASRRNYDTAVLVAGDEDYVPLVEAVKAEGRTVMVWFLEYGLSPILRRKADHYADIGNALFV